MDLKIVARDAIEVAAVELVDAEDYGTSEGARLGWLHRHRKIPKKILANLEFDIVQLPEIHFPSSSAAFDWAINHGVVGTMTELETDGKGRVDISRRSLREMLNPMQRSKSCDWDTHFSAITVLRELVAKSHVVETHPDYKKGPDGKRSRKYGINPGVMIDVAYSALVKKGNGGDMPYRVKLTLKRFDDKYVPTRAYAYHVETIEVEPGTLAQPVSGPHPRGSTSINESRPGRTVEKPNPHHQGRTSLPADILLKGVADVNGDPLL